MKHHQPSPGPAVLLAALIVLPGLVLGGCAGAKNQPLTFAVALQGDIESLDPGRSWDVNSLQVTSVFAESLLEFDENAELVPSLAESWAQTGDTTYVYDIRDDVRFSDGTPMTMDDVLFSLERSRDPAGGTYFAGFWEEVASIRAEGWRLIITLKQPSAVFKYIPATGAARVISRARYEDEAASAVVGTGPYACESWTPGREIVFVTNRYYKPAAAAAAGPAGRAPDRVVFHIIPEGENQTLALQSGSIDFALNITFAQYKNLRSTGADSAGVEAFRVSTGNVTYLALNTSREPMNDINVRRAIYHAIDFPRYSRDYLGEAGAAPLTLPFCAEAYGMDIYGENRAKWTAWEKTLSGPAYNLELARKYLAASAYSGGFPCVLVTTDSPFDIGRAWFVRDSLAPLGIEVEVLAVPAEDWTNLWRTGKKRDAAGRRDYDMIFTRWIPDYPDIQGIVTPLYVSTEEAGGYNCAAYTNREIDALLEAASAEMDPDKRFAIQKRFVEIVLDELPYIPFETLYQFGASSRDFDSAGLGRTWPWNFPVHLVRAAAE